jgi:flagellar export protein FliJ
MARVKSLNTLIRLQKQKVDELRRRQGALENKRQQLLQRLEDLADELKKEQKLASENPEMGGFFGDFAGRIRLRREETTAEIKKVEKQMDELAAQIRAAFAEQKRYEIVRDQRLAEQRAQLEKRETEQLDETGAQAHERKPKESV